jgi:hypothetical protein
MPPQLRVRIGFSIKSASPDSSISSRPIGSSAVASSSAGAFESAVGSSAAHAPAKIVEEKTKKTKPSVLFDMAKTPR